MKKNYLFLNLLLMLCVFSCIDNDEIISEKLAGSNQLDYTLTDENSNQSTQNIIAPNGLPILTDNNFMINQALGLTNEEIVGYSLTISKLNVNAFKWCHVRYKEGAFPWLDQFDNTNLYYQTYSPNIYTTTGHVYNNTYNYFLNCVSNPNDFGLKFNLALSFPTDGYYVIGLGRLSNGGLAIYGDELNNAPIKIKDFEENIIVNLRDSNYVFYAEANTTIKRGRFAIDHL